MKLYMWKHVREWSIFLLSAPTSPSNPNGANRKQLEAVASVLFCERAKCHTSVYIETG